MITIGLTGGIGTGKSTVANLLAARDVQVIDTDQIAHELTGPGEPALTDIAKVFGIDILDQAGRLRRQQLAELVFSSPEERGRLEQILHPRIRERWRRRLDVWRASKVATACVVIPLLYETEAQACFEVVICTGCRADTQHERLRQRNWNDEQIARRLAAQLPLRTKLERADFVVWTEGSLAATTDQVDLVMSRVPGLRPRVP